MALTLTNEYGQVDLLLIRDEDIAELKAPQQECLSLVIDRVKAREAAEVRKINATKRHNAAVAAETVSLEANNLANPAPSFMDARAAAMATSPKGSNRRAIPSMRSWVEARTRQGNRRSA